LHFLIERYIFRGRIAGVAFSAGGCIAVVAFSAGGRIAVVAFSAGGRIAGVVFTEGLLFTVTRIPFPLG
jgi:hypothetical protein